MSGNDGHLTMSTAGQRDWHLEPRRYPANSRAIRLRDMAEVAVHSISSGACQLDTLASDRAPSTTGRWSPTASAGVSPSPDDSVTANGSDAGGARSPA